MNKKEVEHNEKRKLLNLSEISLILDTYDDIFSDFDPRPYDERALSDDFLLEAKKAARDKNNHVQLNFLIPKKQRNLDEEKLIKSRLKEHFEKHLLSLEHDKNRTIKRGIKFTLVGVILMLFTTFILLKREESNFFITFMVILFEPGAWFLFWEGLNQIVFESKKVSPNIHFYKKMVNAEIEFIGV